MINDDDDRFTITDINGRTDIDAIEESYVAKKLAVMKMGVTGRSNIIAAAGLDEDELLYHVKSEVFATRKNMAWEGFETTDAQIAIYVKNDLLEVKQTIKELEEKDD